MGDLMQAAKAEEEKGELMRMGEGKDGRGEDFKLMAVRGYDGL